MSKDNGGPAFASQEYLTSSTGESYFHKAYPGMTLRDYFAAKASEEDIQEQLKFLPKIKTTLSNGALTNMAWRLPSNARQIARYMHADAMLAERDK